MNGLSLITKTDSDNAWWKWLEETYGKKKVKEWIKQAKKEIRF